jgi:hypothetical protein
MAIRRKVLGDAHVDRAEAAKTTLDADFQTFITEGAWGSVWSRPGLTLRERSLLTLTHQFPTLKKRWPPGLGGDLLSGVSLRQGVVLAKGCHGGLPQPLRLKTRADDGKLVQLNGEC